MQIPCGIEGWDAFRSIPLMNPCPLTAPRIHNLGCSGVMGNMCDIFNHRLTPTTSTYSSGFVTNSPVIALMPRVTARNLQMFVVPPPATPRLPQNMHLPRQNPALSSPTIFSRDYISHRWPGYKSSAQTLTSCFGFFLAQLTN